MITKWVWQQHNVVYIYHCHVRQIEELKNYCWGDQYRGLPVQECWDQVDGSRIKGEEHLKLGWMLKEELIKIGETICEIKNQ